MPITLLDIDEEIISVIFLKKFPPDAPNLTKVALGHDAQVKYITCAVMCFVNFASAFDSVDRVTGG